MAAAAVAPEDDDAGGNENGKSNDFAFDMDGGPSLEECLVTALYEMGNNNNSNVG